jgi:hypothetical protein
LFDQNATEKALYASGEYSSATWSIAEIGIFSLAQKKDEGRSMQIAELYSLLWSPVILAGIGIPLVIAAFLVGLRLRNSGMLQSSADFLVVPLTLDFGYALFPKEYEELYEYIGKHAISNEALIALVLINIVAIWFVVWDIETVLSTAVPRNPGPDVFLALIIAWGLAAVILFLHLAVLV